MITKAFDVYNIEAESPIAVTPTGAVTRITGSGNPGAITQPAWFIDPVNGDDTNGGETAGDAIRTHEEFRKRIGSQIIGGPNGPDEVTVPINMVITLLNNFPLDNPVYIDFKIGNQGTLTYKNGKTLSTLATSGPGTVYTNINAAVNQAQQVADPTITWGASGLVNAALGPMIRIRMTSGAATGAIAYTAKDLGANTVRTSAFTTVISSVPTASSPSIALFPVNGDQFVVESGFVTIADFRVNSSGSSLGSSTGASTRLFFFELALPQLSGQRPLVAFEQSQNSPNGFPEIFFSACDVGTIEPRQATFVALSNSKLSGLGNIVADGRLSIASGLCTQVLNFQSAGAHSQLFFDFLIQGGNLFVNVVSLFCERVAVFDSIGDAILVNPGACYRAENLFFQAERTYGLGSTGRGVRVRSSCGALSFQSTKPTITGALGDVIVGGTATTWAAFGNNFTNLTNLATVSLRA